MPNWFQCESQWDLQNQMRQGNYPQCDTEWDFQIIGGFMYLGWSLSVILL